MYGLKQHTHHLSGLEFKGLEKGLELNQGVSRAAHQKHSLHFRKHTQNRTAGADEAKGEGGSRGV